jgi:hypothetical protein
MGSPTLQPLPYVAWAPVLAGGDPYAQRVNWRSVYYSQQAPASPLVSCRELEAVRAELHWFWGRAVIPRRQPCRPSCCLHQLLRPLRQCLLPLFAARRVQGLKLPLVLAPSDYLFCYQDPKPTYGALSSCGAPPPAPRRTARHKEIGLATPERPQFVVPQPPHEWSPPPMPSDGRTEESNFEEGPSNPSGLLEGSLVIPSEVASMRLTLEAACHTTSTVLLRQGLAQAP